MYDTLQRNFLKKTNTTRMINNEEFFSYMWHPIPLVKVKYDGKSEKYLVKLKFCRGLMSSTSDIYEFRMYLIDNGEPEEHFFVCA